MPTLRPSSWRVSFPSSTRFDYTVQCDALTRKIMLIPKQSPCRVSGTRSTFAIPFRGPWSLSRSRKPHLVIRISLHCASLPTLCIHCKGSLNFGFTHMSESNNRERPIRSGHFGGPFARSFPENVLPLLLPNPPPKVRQQRLLESPVLEGHQGSPLNRSATKQLLRQRQPLMIIRWHLKMELVATVYDCRTDWWSAVTNCQSLYSVGVQGRSY